MALTGILWMASGDIFGYGACGHCCGDISVLSVSWKSGSMPMSNNNCAVGGRHGCKYHALSKTA